MQLSADNSAATPTTAMSLTGYKRKTEQEQELRRKQHRRMLDAGCNYNYSSGNNNNINCINYNNNSRQQAKMYYNSNARTFWLHYRAPLPAITNLTTTTTTTIATTAPFLNGHRAQLAATAAEVAVAVAAAPYDNMPRYSNNHNNNNNNQSNNGNNNGNNNSNNNSNHSGSNKRCLQKFANGNLVTGNGNAATVGNGYQQQHNNNNNNSNGRHNAQRKSRYNNNNKSNGAYNMQKRSNGVGSDAPWHRFVTSSCIEEKFLGQHNPGHRNSTSSEATSEDINSSDEHLNLSRINLKRNLNKAKMLSVESSSNSNGATAAAGVATGAAVATANTGNKSRSKRQQKSQSQSLKAAAALHEANPTQTLAEVAAVPTMATAATGKTNNSGKQCKQPQQQQQQGGGKWRSSSSGCNSNSNSNNNNNVNGNGGNCKRSGVNKTKVSLKCGSNNHNKANNTGGRSNSSGGNSAGGNSNQQQQHHHQHGNNHGNSNTKSSRSCSSTSSSALSSPGSSPNSSSSGISSSNSSVSICVGNSSHSYSHSSSTRSISASGQWQRGVGIGSAVEERHHKSQRQHQNQNLNFLVPPLRQYEHLDMDDATLQQQLQRYLIDPHLLRVYGFPVESVVHEGAIEIFKCLPHMSFAAAHVMAVAEAPLTVINCHDGLNASEEIIESSSSSSSNSSSNLQLNAGSTSTDSGNISPRSLDSESAGEWSGSECESSPGRLELYCNYNNLDERSLAKQCVRCKQDFLVDEQSGQYLTRDECSYHWGKYHRCYDGPAVVNRWTCCNALDEAAGGCTRHELHVWTGSVVGVNGPYRDFVHTRPRRGQAGGKASSSATSAGVYALDCEMSYTGRGLDVTKVSLVALNGQLVYEHYVRPDADIVDYNTRYSGVTAKDLKSAGVKTLAEVQRDLLQLIDADTILIGHGLDNDLRALRLVHNTLIDTSITFPHSSGFPYRRALRQLTKTHLNREIQSGDGATGHSSFEDSRACMELMLWRVRRELDSDSCSWED